MAQRVKNKPELKIVVSNTPEAPAVEPVPEQVEMPFAIVNGEPVTQMPKDLYIPPQAMEVFLEAFEGPLDLLLYLIRRQNLNILDIPLAEITRQYMQYIEVMTELQLELAGEYMVMAATLAEIKSRMLLPRPKVDPDGKEEDPRAELVRRLQEYERFKRAAESIDTLPRLERDVWTTSAELKDRSVVKLLPTVTLQEMLLAFKDVVIRSEMFAHHHISRERLSVRERMSDVLTQLAQASFVEFVRLFRLEEGRMGVTVTFMALLELVREGLIEIVQAVPFAPLHVRAAGAGRKLHVVGGNEALADGTLVDDTAAAVVGESVVGDVPAVGLMLPGDAGLDSIVEQELDPNFVDDDFDEDEEPLEGVDDVVAREPAPAAPAPSAPGPEVGPADAGSVEVPAVPGAEVGLADVGAGAGDAVGLVDVAPLPGPEVGLADAGAGVGGAIGLIDVLAAPAREVGLADAAASGQVVAEGVPAVAGASADVTAGGEGAVSAALADFAAGAEFGAGADFGAGVDQGGGREEPASGAVEPVSVVIEPVSVVDEWADSVDPAAMAYAPADEVAAVAPFTGEAVDFQAEAPDVIAAAVDLPPSGISHEPPPVAADAVALAVESVLVTASADVSLPTAGVAQDAIVAQQPSAYEIASAEFAESPASPSEAVVGSATALDEAGAIVESVAAVGNVADPFQPASAIADVTLSSPVDESSQTAFVAHDAAAGEVASHNDVGAVVELTSTADLSPLADLATTDTATPAGVTAPDVSLAGVVSAADVSPFESPTSDFSSQAVDFASSDVAPTVDFGAPDEAASPDSTAVHFSAALSDLVTPGVSEPVDFVAPDVSDPVSADALPPAGTSTSADVTPHAGGMTSADVLPPADGLTSADVLPPAGTLTSADVLLHAGGSTSADAPSPSSDEPAVTAVTTGDDIAVTFDPSVIDPAAVAIEPSLTDVSSAASEPVASNESAPAPDGELSANDEVGATIDPAVFDAPTATAESEPPADTPLDEPPAFDAEYESPEEAVAAGEQPAVDEDVSLIGDTPVAGEASLIGDESVSGGPAIEVEEFAFNELPALDDAGSADQQPAAGAEAVVNKVAGTDEPPSPGEESDD